MSFTNISAVKEMDRDPGLSRRTAIQSAVGVLSLNMFTTRTSADASGPTVYVGSEGDGTLYAVDAVTGDQKWAFTEPSDWVGTSPIVVDGTVYIGSFDTTLYAVDAETGRREWRFTEPSRWLSSPPTIVGGTIYLAAGSDPTMYAVDAKTGEKDWEFTEPTGSVRGAPMVLDQTVYIGADEAILGPVDEVEYEGRVYAVDTESEAVDWRFTEPTEGVSTSPLVSNGILYIGTEGSRLYAVDAGTGEKEWEFSEGSSHSIRSPTAVDGTVYFSISNLLNGLLYAKDAETGDREWESPADLRIYTAPTVAKGRVFVGGANGALYAFDADTGELLWDFTEPSKVVASTPTVADGLVYVGSQDETLYAVDAETGEKAWEFTEPNHFLTSPTVVENPVNGSSIDSRVELATHGHHDEIDRENPGQANFEYEGDDGFGPGFGVGGALAALGGAGYLWHRQRQTGENE